VSGDAQARLREALGEGSLFRNLVLRRVVGSTNDVVRELAAAGAAEGTVVLAEEQTAGRGRHGRRWHSAPGAGLYLSTLLVSEAPAPELTRWTLGAAVAACEACRRVTGAEVTIRWPNDLLWSGRKLGGILSEARSSAGVSEIVVGLGLNLSHGEDEFPAELAGRATSLRLACGVVPDRETLAACYLRALESVHRDLTGGRWSAVARRWEALAPEASGRPIRVRTPDEPAAFEGSSAGLDATGALRVRRADGTLVLVRQADAVVMREE